MNEVSLSINGTRYINWGDLIVVRSLETAPWSFEFSVENTWRDDTKRRIVRGDKVQVKHGNEVMITGYVDRVLSDYDDKSHSLRIIGRSKLADLIDCNGVEKQYEKKTLAQIATEIAKPFGIDVIDEARKTQPFQNLTIGNLEVLWDFLEEAARMRAVRLCDSPDGNLVIRQKLTELSPTELVLGKNILAASSEKSAMELFSEYTVFSDSVSSWASSAPGKKSQGVSTDAGIRYRPRVIQAAGPGNNAECATRADLHKRIARARAIPITYTLLGWTDERGKTWQPGVKVSVLDEYSDISGVLTIIETRARLGIKGMRTEITVMPNYVFEPIPTPEPKDEGPQLELNQS